MLAQVAPNVWCAQDSISMPGKICFPIRMTIIRLSGSRLLLHSPIEMNDALAKAIDQLGKVTWLVGPNCFHHLYLRGAQERWPQAALWLAPSLDKKRKNLNHNGILSNKGLPEWQDELSCLVIDGLPKLNELVFFHHESRTLVVSDLLFNMHCPANKRTGLLLKMVGAYKKPGQSRLLRLLTKDRQKAGVSAGKIFQWNFSRILMAHGEIIETNARETLASALSWMLKGQQVPNI